jgi:hypothetical protein
VKTGQILRIALALAIIFVCGVITGRLTAPTRTVALAGPGGKAFNADDLVARFTAEVGLDEKQQGQLRPIVEEMVRLMAPYPPASNERLEVLQRYRPKVAAILRPDQQAAFDRFTEESNRRFNRIRKRRNEPQQSSPATQGLPGLPPPKSDGTNAP